MRTNDEMVDALKAVGAIRSANVEKAFRNADRALFAESKDYAYEDMALPTRYGQTISAPGVVAIMLEWLDVRTGMNVLDVGSGSGYNAALLAELAGTKGRVVTIERYEELSGLAKNNIAKLGVERRRSTDSRRNVGVLETRNNVVYETGDGSGGCPEYAPYDRIIVAAAMPWLDGKHPLAKQLKKDGKLVAPVGGRFFQELIVYDRKRNEGMKILDVAFVPLIGKYGFTE